MKRVLLVAFLFGIAPAFAEDSDHMGQPDFFGRIDVTDVSPEVINPKPVIIEHGDHDGGRDHKSIYMHVRPGEERQWSHHCFEYNACDRSVYFVDEKWYNDVYSHYRDEMSHGGRGGDHGGRGEGGRGERGGRGEGRGGEGRGGDHGGRGGSHGDEGGDGN